MNDALDSEFDLPKLYRHHIFACLTQRPPSHPRGSCGASGAQALWEKLCKTIEAERLTDVGFTAAGCLGFCAAGPLMVVYPDGVWYRSTTPEDIDEIVSSQARSAGRSSGDGAGAKLDSSYVSRGTVPSCRLA